jgi:hypothetical protein
MISGCLLISPVQAAEGVFNNCGPAEAGPQCIASWRSRAQRMARSAGDVVYVVLPTAAGVGCQVGGCGPPRVGMSAGYTSLPWMA